MRHRYLLNVTVRPPGANVSRARRHAIETRLQVRVLANSEHCARRVALRRLHEANYLVSRFDSVEVR